MNEHFKSILKCAEPELINSWSDLDVQQMLPLYTSENTIQEIRYTTIKLKNNRSPGEDPIAGEMLKAMKDADVEKS